MPLVMLSEVSTVCAGGGAGCEASRESAPLEGVLGTGSVRSGNASYTCGRSVRSVTRPHKYCPKHSCTRPEVSHALLEGQTHKDHSIRMQKSACKNASVFAIGNVIYVVANDKRVNSITITKFRHAICNCVKQHAKIYYFSPKFTETRCTAGLAAAAALKERPLSAKFRRRCLCVRH